MAEKECLCYTSDKQTFSCAAKSSKQSFAPSADPLILLLLQFYYRYIVFILLLINLVVLYLLP